MLLALLQGKKSALTDDQQSKGFPKARSLLLAPFARSVEIHGVHEPRSKEDPLMGTFIGKKRKRDRKTLVLPRKTVVFLSPGVQFYESFNQKSSSIYNFGVKSSWDWFLKQISLGAKEQGDNLQLCC